MKYEEERRRDYHRIYLENPREQNENLLELMRQRNNNWIELGKNILGSENNLLKISNRNNFNNRNTVEEKNTLKFIEITMKYVENYESIEL